MFAISSAMPVRVAEHQVLHDELDVDHAAAVVLDVEAPARDWDAPASILSRIATTSSRSAAARAAARSTSRAHRLETRRRSPASPATQRARVSAWCSHTHA